MQERTYQRLLPLSLMLVVAGCCGEVYTTHMLPSSVAQDGSVEVKIRGYGSYNDDNFQNGDWLFHITIESDSAFTYYYRSLWLVSLTDLIYPWRVIINENIGSNTPGTTIVDFLWESAPPPESLSLSRGPGTYSVFIKFRPPAHVDMISSATKILGAGIVATSTDTVNLQRLRYSPTRESCR